MDLAKVMKLIETRGVELVRFELSDMYGVARCKTIPTSFFSKKATEGLNYGLGFMNKDPLYREVDGSKGYLEDRRFGDCTCYPDFDTFTMLPWCENVGRILLEPTLHEAPIPEYPRHVAKTQLDRLKGLGMSLLSAHEYEFYLVHRDTRKPIYDVGNLRAITKIDRCQQFYSQVAKDLPKVGICIECLESGGGAGQQEITYAPAFGIRAADNAHTYKTGIKEIALQHNYMATFMAVPFPDDDPSGSQFCHSLWDVTEKKSLMYDPNDPTGLSKTAQHWVAGILTHAPGLAVLMSPTVNCFSRYEFTPVNATWGNDNRSCYLRVKVNREAGTYIENRAGSSASNPYLTLAGTVAAGIDGIKRKLTLPDGVVRSAYNDENIPSDTSTIPHNMKDALKAFLDDQVIIDALSEEFVNLYTAAKTNEIELEESARKMGNNDWEHELYFETM